MSSVHFIGGEKGGVGKSVVARLVAQYFIDHGTPFAAFDADGSHGALLRHYADFAHPVDLLKLESADTILTPAFDQGKHVVVDLPAQSDRALSAWILETGVLDLAKESDVDVVFWHVIDDGKDSITTLDRLLARHGDAARYCVVKNRGRGSDFSLFEASATRTRLEALYAHVVDLPELSPAAMQKVDKFDLSFWAAVNSQALGEAFTRMDRQRIKVWLQACYDELGRLGTLA